MRVVGIAIVMTCALAAPARGDRAAACAEARAALGKKDLVRASIAAGECGDAGLTGQIDAAAAKAGHSRVEVDSKPSGATVVVTAADDRSFTTPAVIWLPPGWHDVRAPDAGVQVSVQARDGNPARAYLPLPAPREVKVKDGVVDLSEDGGIEETSGPPPEQEFGSLLPDRYQKGLRAEGEAEAAPSSRHGFYAAAGASLIWDDRAAGSVDVAYRGSRGGRLGFLIGVGGHLGSDLALAGVSGGVELALGPVALGVGPSAWLQLSPEADVDGGGFAQVSFTRARWTGLARHAHLFASGADLTSLLVGLRW